MLFLPATLEGKCERELSKCTIGKEIFYIEDEDSSEGEYEDDVIDIHDEGEPAEEEEYDEYDEEDD